MNKKRRRKRVEEKQENEEEEDVDADFKDEYKKKFERGSERKKTSVSQLLCAQSFETQNELVEKIYIKTYLFRGACVCVSVFLAFGLKVKSGSDFA